jgi:predicted nucleic acid-binding protein
VVILDTSIIIDHLRSSAKRHSALMQLVEAQPSEVLALSLISLQELYEGQSTRDSEREKDLLAIISPLRLLPYTYEIAKLAGCIARDCPRPIELADAAIAATAIYHQAQLFTLNTKDFLQVEGVELAPLKIT